MCIKSYIAMIDFLQALTRTTTRERLCKTEGRAREASSTFQVKVFLNPIVNLALVGTSSIPL